MCPSISWVPRTRSRGTSPCGCATAASSSCSRPPPAQCEGSATSDPRAFFLVGSSARPLPLPPFRSHTFEPNTVENEISEERYDCAARAQPEEHESFPI
jgi:hypothetical protein